MQLTRQTDYALRLLIYLAASGRRVSIAEVAAAQAVSRTHLMKIANLLTTHGFVAAARGRGGGISLARPAAAIILRDVIRATEPSCSLVDCSGCKLVRRCRLEPILGEASAAFWHVLGGYSLADLVSAPAAAPMVSAPAPVWLRTEAGPPSAEAALHLEQSISG